MVRSSNCLALCILVAGFFLAGCSGDNPLGREAVSGNVTWNGTPLPSGAIGFEPEQEQSVSSGATIHNGVYQIPRLNGLPPGRYTVRINAAVADEEAMADQPPGAPPPPGLELLPAKYNTKTELVIEIHSGGDNVCDFELVK